MPRWVYYPHLGETPVIFCMHAFFLAVNHLYDPLGFSSGMVINNFCHNNKIQQVFFPKEVVFSSLSLVHLTGLQFQILLSTVNVFS